MSLHKSCCPILFLLLRTRGRRRSLTPPGILRVRPLVIFCALTTFRTLARGHGTRYPSASLVLHPGQAPGTRFQTSLLDGRTIGHEGIARGPSTYPPCIRSGLGDYGGLKRRLCRRRRLLLRPRLLCCGSGRRRFRRHGKVPFHIYAIARRLGRLAIRHGRCRRLILLRKVLPIGSLIIVIVDRGISRYRPPPTVCRGGSLLHVIAMLRRATVVVVVVSTIGKHRSATDPS
mmetsp:Transcript_16474/g.35645  ORF Transcript_16474/g.35645 Transcript_16474/m.35645 type:complete len:231 (-) Transcript_16474:642-1334(-)